LASAGWDKKFHVWDARVRTTSSSSRDCGGDGVVVDPVSSADLPGKAYGMDVSRDGNMVVVATSGRRNCFLDLRMLHPSKSSSRTTTGGEDDDEKENGNDDDDGAKIGIEAKVMMDRESSLKYQTRCVKFFGMPNTMGIAVGSIEGRVAIEYMDDMGIESNGGECV
jgi:cell cycle arrest protein BUB3